MQQLSSKSLATGIILIIIGGVVGYYLAGQAKYDEGYAKGFTAAEESVTKVQDEAAKQAAEEATKAANPFQATNPLEGVEANPFEKAKKILNPFE